jgi:hypothetical protein
MSKETEVIEETKNSIFKRAKCPRCKVEDASDSHSCPFQAEINDDSGASCDCCPDCEDSCRMSI